MKEYNFDEIIDREKTNCLKYDGCHETFGADKLIPLWVADMDFQTPNFVFDAFAERIEPHILGYYIHTSKVYQSIIDWMKRRHQWNVEKEWIFFATGVMSSIYVLVQIFSNPGDKVIVLSPVYSPFYSVIENQKREVIKCPLIMLNNQYKIDFNHLELCLKQSPKMLIMCNPHNPVGRCWSKEELKKLGELCLQYQCLVISDEIHSDLIMPEFKHTPIANISKEIAQNTIVCMSPTKTFNLSALSISVIIIPNARLRERYMRYRQGIHLSQGNIFGEIAIEACYTYGEEWLTQLLYYIKGNVDYIQQYIKNNIPQIKTVQHEATFLLWLDFSEFGLSHKEISRILTETAKVAINSGIEYGNEGENHFRINVACPRAILVKAMSQLKCAFENVYFPEKS